jgi:UDP-glucose:glycoprotein glucosyltransferase
MHCNLTREGKLRAAWPCCRMLIYSCSQQVSAQAVFRGLPTEPIYTLGTDVPASWLVRPREALYDLDNIQLGILSPEDHIRGVEAVFDLDYLVVEGHVRDSKNNFPPRGVQLQLTSHDSSPIDDTQVVANLGYIQFKAKPGIFRLEIRPGRGRDIFEMESAGNEGWDSPTVEQAGDEITLIDFEGLTLYPRLKRLPGMESEDVLDGLTQDTEGSKNPLEHIMSRYLRSGLELCNWLIFS